MAFLMPSRNAKRDQTRARAGALFRSLKGGIGAQSAPFESMPEQIKHSIPKLPIPVYFQVSIVKYNNGSSV